MITSKAPSFILERFLGSLQADARCHHFLQGWKKCTNVCFSSAGQGGHKWNLTTKRSHNGICSSSSNNGRLNKKQEKEISECEGERRVHCEVEVISWRERRIKAQISVQADLRSVWNVLTDYERLADFIPNLVCSGRIPCPHSGRIWLEQRGLQRALYWHIEARVVLDLQEFPYSATNHELHFSMVDGDFKKFEGKWSLNAGTSKMLTEQGFHTKSLLLSVPYYTSKLGKEVICKICDEVQHIRSK